MHIILVPGIWLDGTSWSRVIPALRRAGHQARPLTLPGMESRDADRSHIRLRDHVDAVVDAIEMVSDDVVIVGHSTGASVVQAAADVRPDRVARAIYVSGFPVPEGEPIAADHHTANGETPLPNWTAFSPAALADLDAVLQAEMRLRTIPSPAHVTHDPQHFTDPDRSRVPITVIATDFTSKDLQQRIDQGDPAVAELQAADDLTLLDLPTGHWPQFTRPDDLARLILEAIRQPTPHAPTT